MKTTLAVLALAAVSVRAASAQCYTFSSGSAASLTVNITNLPAPTMPVQGIYQYSSNSGLAATASLTVGQTTYNPSPSVPIDLYITVSSDPNINFSQFSLNVAFTSTNNTVVGALPSLAWSGTFFANGSLPGTLPAISAASDPTMVVSVIGPGGTIVDQTYTLTAINSCSAGPTLQTLETYKGPDPQNCSSTVQVSNSFSPADTTVNVFFVVNGMSPTGGDTVTLHWINPSNSWAWTTPWAPTLNAGSSTRCFYVDFSIAQYIAPNWGQWQVQVYANGNSVGAPYSFQVTNIAQGTPGVVSINPVVSTGSAGFYTFQFSDTAGWQTLAVVNVLINTALDGRQACYLAFVPSGPSSGSLLLVDDAGDAGGPFSGMMLPGSASINNTQCSVSGAGSLVSAVGDTLTLVLNVSFSPSFAGNKVVYAAARDAANNSGWQTMGVRGVPPLPTTFPNPTGLSPSWGDTLAQTIAFSYQDQSSATNLQTVWALINTALDGRQACYIAYYRPGNQVYLYPDNGDGTQATSMVLTGNNIISNSQCAVSAQGANVQASGSTLTVSLPITFKTAFAGFKGVWMAAYTLSGAVSPWQALGAWDVPSN